MMSYGAPKRRRQPPSTTTVMSFFLAGSLKCADNELELYLRWDLMEQMGRICGWASPPRLYCKNVSTVAECLAGTTAHGLGWIAARHVQV